MPLTDDIKDYLDKAATLIQAESDTEDTLYEAMDYLEESASAQSLADRTGPERARIMRVWTHVWGGGTPPPGAADNISVGKALGADPPTDKPWNPEEEKAFPKIPGTDDKDPQYMLLRISEGSTTWCYYLSDGTKKCYTR